MVAASEALVRRLRAGLVLHLLALLVTAVFGGLPRVLQTRRFAEYNSAILHRTAASAPMRCPSRVFLLAL